MSNVLIIKLGALGDVIISTSIIRKIQRCHTGDKLYLLTSKPFDQLFKSWDGLKLRTMNRNNLLDNFKTLAWIRKKRCEYLYDLQSNDRTGILCALSGAAKRVGNHPRFPYNIHPDEPYRGQCHIYQRMLDLLESADIDATPDSPYLPVSNNDKRKVQAWLVLNNLSQKQFVIIHAGSSYQHPEKRWPYYKNLAKYLSEYGHLIIWVGASDDINSNRELSSVTGIDATDMFTFSELAELGRHASFAITNDSGPMHILSCSGIPVYAFFGPTNWRRNHAISQEKYIIAAQNINNLSGNRHENFKPMGLDRISLDAVIEHLKKDNVV